MDKKNNNNSSNSLVFGQWPQTKNAQPCSLRRSKLKRHGLSKKNFPEKYFYIIARMRKVMHVVERPFQSYHGTYFETTRSSPQPRETRRVHLDCLLSPLPGKQVTWTDAAEAQAYPKSVEISSILCAGTFSSRRPQSMKKTSAQLWGRGAPIP